MPGRCGIRLLSFSPFKLHDFVIDQATDLCAVNDLTLLVPRSGTADVQADDRLLRLERDSLLIAKANITLTLVPQKRLAATVVWVHPDYLTDQLYWKHVDLIPHRSEAQSVTDRLYNFTVQQLAPGREVVTQIRSQLDLMHEIQNREDVLQHLFLSQAHWHYLLHLISPFVKVTQPLELSDLSSVCSGGNRTRRSEIVRAAKLLSDGFAEAWTLSRLSDEVHVSPSHLRRLFIAAFGVSPRAFLVERRVEHLAYLLREGQTPVSEAILSAGWRKRENADRHFARITGHTLAGYRRQHSRETPQ